MHIIPKLFINVLLIFEIRATFLKIQMSRKQDRIALVFQFNHAQFPNKKCSIAKHPFVSNILNYSGNNIRKAFVRPENLNSSFDSFSVAFGISNIRETSVVNHVSSKKVKQSTKVSIHQEKA